MQFMVDPNKTPSASITVLFAGLDIDHQRFVKNLGRISGDAGIVLDGPIPGIGAIGGNGEPSALGFTVNGVHVTCSQIGAPAPGLAAMIQTTRMENAVLDEAFKGHTSHMLCWTKGGSGLDQTIALFQVAAALADDHALGVIHTSAWQCFTLDQITKMLDPDFIDGMRNQGVAKALWCNLIPFHGKGGTWWTTKGNFVFGIPDFTLWNPGTLDQPKVRTLLQNLFDHVQGGAKINHGEIIAFPPYRLQAGPVTEFKDFIAGEGGTIALRFIGKGVGEPGAAQVAKAGGSSLGCLFLVALVVLAIGGVVWHLMSPGAADDAPVAAHPAPVTSTPSPSPAPAPVAPPPVAPLPAPVPAGPVTWHYTVTCNAESDDNQPTHHDFSAQTAAILAAIKARAPSITFVPDGDARPTTGMVKIMVHVHEFDYAKHGNGNVTGTLPVAMNVAIQLADGAVATWASGKNWMAMNSNVPAVNDSGALYAMIRPAADKLAKQIVAKIAQEAEFSAKSR
jgi:hypothetical protein